MRDLKTHINITGGIALILIGWAILNVLSEDLDKAQAIGLIALATSVLALAN